MAAATLVDLARGAGAAWVLVAAASTALAQTPLDVSKLKKGDLLEMKSGANWVLVEFEKPHNQGVIIVRRKSDGQQAIALATIVRLPEGDAGNKTAVPPKPRTWTDRSGKFKIVATLVKEEGGKVILKRKSDAKEITIPLEKLGDADQKYLKSLAAPAKPTASDAAKPANGPMANDAPPEGAEPNRASPTIPAPEGT